MTHRLITPGAVSWFKLLLAVIAICAAHGSTARADVPPPDACETAGTKCGPAGTCTCATTTCGRVIACMFCGSGNCVELDAGTFEGDAAARTKLCLSQYPCARCRTSGGDFCSNENVDGGATDEQSGCSCSTTHHNDLANAWLFAGALLALWMRRRASAAS